MEDLSPYPKLEPVPGRPGWVRKKRYSLVVALLAAMVTFPIALLITSFILGVVLGELLSALAITEFIPDWLLLAVGLPVGAAAPLVVSCLIARGVYLNTRWEYLEDRAGRYCVRCRYDLTGNVSGRCPECGHAIKWPGNRVAELDA